MWRDGGLLSDLSDISHKTIYPCFLIILCCLLPGGVFAGSLINAGFISDNVNLSTQDFLKFYAIDNVQKKTIH